ncbi:MAG: aldo/keto reductase, partial [Lachnospiraceae bacterium]|nr:aldo/keto reductase [Lachnospiraceae bacterium]
PLAQGLLTERYLNGIPKDSRIYTDGRFLHKDQVEEKLVQIKALNEIAAERGQSLAQMALSWVMKDNEITSVLIGASKPSQILDNCGIVKRACFSKEELDKIDNIVFGRE